MNDFKRPAFILVKTNDEYKGTCRSIESVNIYELLSKNSDILKEFGGHNQAAGFTISPQYIDEFKSRILSELASFELDSFIPRITYDMELVESDVTKEFAAALELLEPTGNNGNPKPLFMTRTSELSATPLKSNSDHTLLKTPGGLQFFAYNSYRLNTYYNGATERELVYELADTDYAPRLYLRGCAVSRLAVNDSVAKAGYLRTLNYPIPDNPEYVKYSESELNDLIDNPFGILLIAGSKSTYDKFAARNNANVIVHEIFAETTVNVYTRVMVSPEFGKALMLENYNKVIFLDYPPSDGIIGYINRHTDAKVYVPEVDNRSEMFSGITSDRSVFGAYYNAIKSNANIKAPNVYAYFKAIRSRVKTLELPQFIVCLSVFTQLGLLKFRPNGGVAVSSASSNLDNSEIYETVKAWQK